MVIIIGITVYQFEKEQVKLNASYLIDNTTIQTASGLNDKLSTIFTQLSKYCDSVAVGSLMVDHYEEDGQSNKYNDILTSYRDMQNIYYTYGDVIHSIYFQTGSGTEIKVYKELVPAETTLDLKQWFKTYKDSPYGYYWRNIHTDDVFRTKDDEQVLSVFRNIGSENSNAQAVVIFNLDPAYFMNIIDSTQISEHGYLMLVSKDGVMKKSGIGEEYQLSSEDMYRLQHTLSGNGAMDCTSAAGEKLSVNYRTLESSHWMLVAVAPQKDFVAIFGSFRYVLLLLIIIMTAVLTLLCNEFAKNIAKPITILSKKVKQFDRGDDGIDFSKDMTSENEIGTLAMGLSGLKQSVYNLLEQVKIEQSQKSRMQLMAMQEQIKPHFLYNTLASIRHLVDLGDVENAGKMCGALEKFYRIGISGGQEIITVREEIEHVESYLSIQQMRYAKDFDYSIDVEDGIMDATILKLTLQPVIENAIYHGMKQKEGRGIIILTGHREGQFIALQVYDDGVGMTEEQLLALRNSIRVGAETEGPKYFGMRNVNQRLHLYFGKEASLDIQSVKDVYTQVTIKIPCEMDGGGNHA